MYRTPDSMDSELLRDIHKAAEYYSANAAISFRDRKLTYTQLNAAANRVAHWLTAKNLQKGDRIVIALERGPEMIVVLLAAIKCGIVYVPVDTFYPAQRVQFMVEDAAAKIVVSDASFINQSDYNATFYLISDILTEAERFPSENPNVEVRAGDLAYILYTSGSTGNPKGAMVTHGNLSHFIAGMQDVFKITNTDKFLSVSSISFDASCFDYYLSLTSGAEIILTDIETAKDGSQLLELARRNGATIMLATPVTYKLMLQSGWEDKLPLKILSAGEVLQPQLAEALLKKCNALYNVYGPTETTVICILTQIVDSDNVTIGKAILNTPIYFVDESLNLVEDGAIGEICIGGAGVANGYLNRPELTTEKFIKNPFTGDAGDRVYRSGDLGRMRADGLIEYLGRIDDQVKIRGYRIELGEIEHQIAKHPEIKETVVTVKEDRSGEKKLVAYLVTKNNNVEKPLLLSSLKQRLASSMPVFMIPEHFIFLKAIPISPNGKRDKNALPGLTNSRPALTALYKQAANPLERNLVSIWEDVLQIENLGIQDDFFELGGNSLLAQKAVRIISETLGSKFPISKLYQYATIEQLAAYINGETVTTNQEPNRKNKQNVNTQEIAIIGMECNFPGAGTIEQFWDVIKNGKETVRFFNDNEIDAAVPTSVKEDALYVKARGVLNGIDQFDAAFFGINPKLAELMDPQQRLFLEASRNLLEKTGNLPATKDLITGVFAGCNTNSYFNNNVVWHRDKIEVQGVIPVSSVNDKDYIASRVAYQLNLNGPAVNINTACSTSLVAIAQAVESLRAGQCDIAIAGAASVTVPAMSGHLYQEGSMLSKDGHTRTFDAEASGTVFSDGVGAVLLKRLDEAEAAGDKIFAVIRGVGVNNDGGEKSSFTAPSAKGQAGAIMMAMEDAGIAAEDISYIEAHGTATPLGDPIEINGLNLAFGNTSNKQYCAIGSAKSNMGHLTHASGVAGIIKTALSLHNGQIPATINFKKENPEIDFANSPFYVNSALSPWNNDRKIAGVSSFGVGGTNCHVIVEAYKKTPDENIDEEEQPVVLTWSAKEGISCEEYGKQLLKFLEQHPTISIKNVATTLAKTRESFSFRTAFAVKGRTELLDKLAQPEFVKTNTLQLKQQKSGVAFLFPGQGSQYVNMGLGLYTAEPVYKNAVDDCADILKEFLGEDIRDTLFNQEANDEATDRLRNTKYAQPAIFITSYALAKLYNSWGIIPVAIAGHSVGEFVAAHLAGVFSLRDALKVIASRGRLISQLNPGSMLSVRASKEQIATLLPAGISIAAHNAPELCVVAGETKDIENFGEQLTAKGIVNKLLRTSHAFHSAMMDPAVAELKKVLETVEMHTPRIPIVSTVSGNWLKDSEAQSAEYWSAHTRATVHFADALKTLATDLDPVFLEAGPGNSSVTFAKQGGFDSVGIFSFPAGASALEELLTVRNSIGKLWQHGISVDWEAVWPQSGPLLQDLPTYAFNKKRYWVDARAIDAVQMQSTSMNDDTHFTLTETIQPAMTRKNLLINKIEEIIESASGISVAGSNPADNFVELGLDSLLLTQLAATLKKELSLPVTFRMLNDEYDSIEKLSVFYDVNLPADKFLPKENMQKQAVLAPANGQAKHQYDTGAQNGGMLELITQQLQLLTRQVSLLQGGTGNSGASSTNDATKPQPVKVAEEELTADEKVEFKKPFGATARIEKKSSDLTAQQQDFIQKLIASYNAKTKASKEYTQLYRSQMADPRVVSGFKLPLKEMVYSIVIKKSKGCYLWDLDDNRYVDALNGFGSNFLGYQPDFLKAALLEQVENGYEIGPQHELAGQVSELICELTGMERVGLCNTGSEAVLGAMRIARTATSKDIIVAFTGSYHGIIDEVLVRGSKKLKTYPAASGILSGNVQNMLILEYGTPESLKIIRERASEIAGVLVEPVQSRRPEFQPVEFLKDLRELTQQNDIALIFDEVITGFRSHPGGAQAVFGIKADIATYGKVVGGGLSIGVIAGRRNFMDTLDGGFWQYGDESIPEVGVTYFAGTFVRHPLALATALATLKYLKSEGGRLQEEMNLKTELLANRLNSIAESLRIPVYVVHFSSLWKIKFREEYPYAELLFTLMRKKNIHIWDGFPCFLTTAHTKDDIDAIVFAFEESLNELIKAEFIPQYPAIKEQSNIFDHSNPPVAGARLGMDKDGNPAWFVNDENNPGKYLQVALLK